MFCFFFQAEDGIRDVAVTGVQTCALPICGSDGCGSDGCGSDGCGSDGCCSDGCGRDGWCVHTLWYELFVTVFTLVVMVCCVYRRLSSTSPDRKSTRLNSSHGYISYAVSCLKKKKTRIVEKKAETMNSHIERFLGVALGKGVKVVVNTVQSE